MELIPVRSSNIARVGYAEATSILEVEFHGATVYQYFGVPARHFSALTNGRGPVGEYFNRNIKGVYKYRRVR